LRSAAAHRYFAVEATPDVAALLDKTGGDPAQHLTITFQTEK
jgi:hypothetical protein